MERVAKSSIIVGIAICVAGSCEKSTVTPCMKGVLVETVGNCYLVIQVLNAPIGKSFTYKRPYPSTDPSTTYTNAVMTTLTISANYLDTIYFKYDKQVQFNCPFGPGLGSRPPDVPSIQVLAYSKAKCP